MQQQFFCQLKQIKYNYKILLIDNQQFNNESNDERNINSIYLYKFSISIKYIFFCSIIFFYTSKIKINK